MPREPNDIDADQHTDDHDAFDQTGLNCERDPDADFDQMLEFEAAGRAAEELRESGKFGSVEHGKDYPSLTDDLVAILSENQYYGLRDTPQGVVGFFDFIFTIGICVGLDNTGYRFRYCYHTRLEAVGALNDWAATGYQDEPQGYIVRKGEGGDKRPAATNPDLLSDCASVVKQAALRAHSDFCRTHGMPEQASTYSKMAEAFKPKD